MLRNFVKKTLQGLYMRKRSQGKDVKEKKQAASLSNMEKTDSLDNLFYYSYRKLYTRTREFVMIILIFHAKNVIKSYQ